MRVKRASRSAFLGSCGGGSASPAGDVMSIGRRARSPLAGRSALGAGTQRFEPRPPIPRALTPPPSAARLRGVRRPTAGGTVLAELNARRHRSERCGVMELAGALHLARAAPSFRSFWVPERPRHAAAADALLAAPSGPTSSGPFTALRLAAWIVGGAIRAYSASCAHGYAARVLAPPLCGACALARGRDFRRLAARWSLRNRDIDMRAVCVRVVVGRWKWYPRPCVELVFAFSCRSGRGYGV